MYAYFLLWVIHHLLIAGQSTIRCADGDVVGHDAKVLQTFLYSYANRTATTPQANNECGTKAAVENVNPEPIGVLEKLLFADKTLVSHAYG